MQNFLIHAYSDVTDNLIFGREFEYFIDRRKVKKELFGGASETKSPLPIVSLLTQGFFTYYRNEPESFNKENAPDKNIIPKILLGVMRSLRLDSSYLQKSNWYSPSPITNEKFLLEDSLDKDKITFPLTVEIMSLIMQVLTSFSQSNTINREFVKLWMSYFNYQQYLKNKKSPKYLMDQRIEELTFKPVTVRTTNGEKTQYTFATDTPSGILSLAWAEFYLSQVYGMPLSICTYCGKVYYLTSKHITAGSCDSEECRKLLRKDRDLIKREADPESEREKDRKRQQAFRDKKKAKELASKGKSIEEITTLINSRAKKRGDNIRSLDEIKKWIRE